MASMDLGCFLPNSLAISHRLYLAKWYTYEHSSSTAQSAEAYRACATAWW